MDLVKKRDGTVEELQDALELSPGVAEARFEPMPLELKVIHPVTDLRALKHSFGGEVDQVRFLGLERGELLVQRQAKAGAVSLLARERAPNSGTELGNPPPLEPLGLVHPLNGFLGLVQWNVRRVACAFLSAAAEEVEVLVPLAHRPGDDHAIVPAFALAPPAEQCPLQVVKVDASPLVGGRARPQYGLDAGEQLWRDERLVPAEEPLIGVGDEPDVVRITEQPPHLLVAERAGRATTRAPCSETALVHLLGELDHRVVVGCAQFERLPHERAALRVDDHGADLAVVDPLPHVEVAERCLRDRAALAGLGRELVLDVRSIGGGPVFVQGGEDAVEHLAFGRLVDVLGRRDQRDAQRFQFCHNEGVVDAVAVHPAELVDDDMGYIAVAPNPFEHRVEGDALGHLAAGDAGLDVLVDEVEPELLRLAPAALPLGRQADALWVVIGLDLLGRRNPQVAHRAFQRRGRARRDGAAADRANRRDEAEVPIEVGRR